MMDHSGLEDLVGHNFDMCGYGEDDVHEEGSPDRTGSSEDSDYYDEVADRNRMDSSAVEGRDIQGIPWERLRFTRSQYRELRLKQYKNYVNLPNSLAELKKECKQVEKASSFYDFQYNTRLVKPTIMHFQLRNLVWATSKHDVYLVHCYSIIHWSSLLRRVREILNVARRISPNIETHKSRARSISRVRVSTMCVKDNLMLAGGFQGELICKRLNREGVAFCSKIAFDENPITNGVDIFRSPSDSVRLMTANNDCHVRVFDAQSFTLLNQFLFPWSVNNTSVSPDGTLLAVLGDSTDCLLTDAQSGKVLEHLKGHLDYSFSSAWHPGGRVLATGSQDKTCRLWDVRNLSKSLAVVRGRMAAIRAIRFTSDGRYMATAEAADFVHILDARAGYEKEAAQQLDFFGEIAGVSFSDDTEALFVGVVDRSLGSLIELRRRRPHHYLDSYF